MSQAAMKVTVIPAKKDIPVNVLSGEERKRLRVAAYARVSTNNEEQLTSYEAQVDYYTNYIKGREDWEFVSVYTDEGISATSTTKRDGFNRMVADALDGGLAALRHRPCFLVLIRRRRPFLGRSPIALRSRSRHPPPGAAAALHGGFSPPTRWDSSLGNHSSNSAAIHPLFRTECRR